MELPQDRAQGQILDHSNQGNTREQLKKTLLPVKEITPASAIACGKLPPTERSLTLAIFRRWSLRIAYDK